MIQVLLILCILIAVGVILCVIGFVIDVGYGWTLRYRLRMAQHRAAEAEQRLVEAFRNQREDDCEQPAATA